MAVVLGLDPGSKRLGWSFQRLDDGYHLIDSGTDGVHRPEGRSYQDHKWDVIRYWWENFPKYLEFGREECLPGESFHVVSELLPVVGARNGGAAAQMNLARTAITVCQVSAMVEDIPWVEMGANSIKLLVAGSGKATKVRVTNGVLQVYPHLKDRERELKDTAKDESDAIAVGLAGLGYKVPTK